MYLCSLALLIVKPPFTVSGKHFFPSCFLLIQWYQDVVMGEDQAREYDTVAIFKHL